jgi:hypothetical protein
MNNENTDHAETESKKRGRKPKAQRARKKPKGSNEKSEEKSIENLVQQFLLDTGRLSYPTTAAEIETEFVSEELCSNLTQNWKHHMELKVCI